MQPTGNELLSAPDASWNPLSAVRPVMQKYGVICSAEEFHRTVNLAFHRAESQVYDQIHRCMWESLPQQFELLAADYFSAGGAFDSRLAVLDIGCGTGLSSELLLKSAIGRLVSQIDLLDTSPEMLARAKERAASWGIRTSLIHGDIDHILKHAPRYELILVCSVLHHIPDLKQFLGRLQSIQTRGGVFLHLQDPNGDYHHDPLLQQRIAELDNYVRPVVPKWLRSFAPKRMIGKLRRGLAGQGGHNYIVKVNEELMSLGVTRTAMTAADLWAVTDIHIHDSHGISLKQLSKMLPDYKQISTRSYAFFGKMASELPGEFRRREQELIAKRGPNGLYVGGIWRLRD